jgi:hypothetical protein
LKKYFILTGKAHHHLMDIWHDPVRDITVEFLAFDGCPLAPRALAHLELAIKQLRGSLKVAISQVDLMAQNLPGTGWCTERAGNCCGIDRRYRALTNEQNKNVAATTGGAISLGAFASFVGLCCIGPWAVALFGVPGAVYLARWQPARPYILGVAALMMMLAFWRVYRPRKVCADGSCAQPPSKWLKFFLWFGAVLLVLAVFAEDLQWLLVDPTPEGLRT